MTATLSKSDLRAAALARREALSDEQRAEAAEAMAQRKLPFEIAKVRRVSLQMSEELGREPTDEELGDELGISASRVGQMRTAAIRPHVATTDPICPVSRTAFR